MQALLRENPPELVIPICKNHNFTKIADTKEARAILMFHKIRQFGEIHMEEYLDNIPWKVTQEFRLAQIMVHLPTNYKL